MVGRALSDAKKKQTICELEEGLCLRAICMYQDELQKPEGKRKGARTVAKDFVKLYKLETGHDMHIDHNLLIRGAAGHCTRAQANASQSHLTPEEATIVCDFIIECGKRGFPLSHQ